MLIPQELQLSLIRTPDKILQKGVRFVGKWRNVVGIWRPCIYLIMS